ncbi:MAG: ribonuclease, partial [Pseudomonadota bacterium]
MAEWLIEDGIGERRALLIDGGEAVAAKLEWPGELTAGTKVMAQLIEKPAGARRGVAQLENSAQVLVDHLPPELTEGASFALQVSRAAIAERGRFKRAQGRYHGPGLGDALPKDEAAANTAFSAAKVVPAFEAGLWEEVWHAASSGSLEFTSGEIVCSVT